jgi:hypothetical protein
MWFVVSSTANRSPGMPAASPFPCSIGVPASWRAWMASVDEVLD